MGSVNTWRTFQYCLDYFRYFMPMSGSGYDGESAAIFRAAKQSADFYIGMGLKNDYSEDSSLDI